MIEYPEYIVCPMCQTKMSIDYSRKRMPYTDGIYNMGIMIRKVRYVDAGKMMDKFIEVSICAHCKGILGVISSS